jgi:hypothetical protein
VTFQHKTVRNFAVVFDSPASGKSEQPASLTDVATRSGGSPPRGPLLTGGPGLGAQRSVNSKGTKKGLQALNDKKVNFFTKYESRLVHLHKHFF